MSCDAAWNWVAHLILNDVLDDTAVQQQQRDTDEQDVITEATTAPLK